MKDDYQLEQVTQADLNAIIRKHLMFLTGRPGGGRAVVRDKDLSGLNFMGQNLSQADFTGSVLANSDMTNANFESSTLFGCDFTGAKLSNTRLVRADMRGADIANADLSKADLTGADLREGKTILKRKTKKAGDQFSATAQAGAVQFTNSDLTGAVLNNATAINANFSDADLSSAQMQGTNLRQAVLKSADLTDANLSGADVRNADFSYATMTGTNLDKAEQNGANFSFVLKGPEKESYQEVGLTLDERIIQHMTWVATGGKTGKRLFLRDQDMRLGPSLSSKRLLAIHASDCNFAEMDMRGIEMQAAHINRCDFRKGKLGSSDLRGCTFIECLFNRADFAKANLTPLIIKKADGSEYRLPCNFSRAVLRQALFNGARLSGAVFSGADLVQADFTHCDLRKTDFRGANIEGAIFTDAIIEGALFDDKAP